MRLFQVDFVTNIGDSCKAIENIMNANLNQQPEAVFETAAVDKHEFGSSLLHVDSQISQPGIVQQWVCADYLFDEALQQWTTLTPVEFGR